MAAVVQRAVLADATGTARCCRCGQARSPPLTPQPPHLPTHHHQPLSLPLLQPRASVPHLHPHLQRLSPLVSATWDELTASAARPTAGGLGFDVVLVDDADSTPLAAVVGGLGLLGSSRLGALVLSVSSSAAGGAAGAVAAGLQAGDSPPISGGAAGSARAFPALGGLLSRHWRHLRLDGEFGPARPSLPAALSAPSRRRARAGGAGAGRAAAISRAAALRPSRLLPIPRLLGSMLGPTHLVLAPAGPAWQASRVAGNLAGAMGVLESLHGAPLGAADQAAIGNEMRELRGGLLNLHEARALLSQAASLLATTEAQKLLIVAIGGAQLALLTAACELSPPLRAARAARRLYLASLDDAVSSGARRALF